MTPRLESLLKSTFSVQAALLMILVNDQVTSSSHGSTHDATPVVVAQVSPSAIGRTLNSQCPKCELPLAMLAAANKPTVTRTDFFLNYKGGLQMASRSGPRHKTREAGEGRTLGVATLAMRSITMSPRGTMVWNCNRGDQRASWSPGQDYQ